MGYIINMTIPRKNPFYPALITVNDIAAIDHAQEQERYNKLLYQCYLSDQVSEAQWTEHLRDNPGLINYVKEQESLKPGPYEPSETTQVYTTTRKE